MHSFACVKTEYVCPVLITLLALPDFKCMCNAIFLCLGLAESGSAVQCNAIDPSGLVVCRVPVSKCNEPEHLPFPLPVLRRATS